MSLTLALVLLAGCEKDFLELKPRGTELEGNFYQNQDQVFQGLISVYDVYQWGTSGGYTMKVPLLTVASDEAYAGGSDASDQPSWVAFDNFTLNPYLGPQTGLSQKGSRINYRFFFKFRKGENVDELMKDITPRLEREGLNYDTVESQKADTSRSLTDLTRFLSLISFIALLLGCIGVASAIHIYVREKGFNR